jgi:hypothetical protein
MKIYAIATFRNSTHTILNGRTEIYSQGYSSLWYMLNIVKQNENICYCNFQKFHSYHPQWKNRNLLTRIFIPMVHVKYRVESLVEVPKSVMHQKFPKAENKVLRFAGYPETKTYMHHFPDPLPSLR